MTWLEVAPPDVIVVDELIVRKYVLSDAPSLREQVRESVDHLRPWMPWIKFEPQNVADKEDLIRGWETEWLQKTNFTMGIFQHDQVVGGTGFHLRGEDGVLEIGYWVGVHHTGKSIATRVTRALTKIAFQLSGVHQVEISHDVANHISGRIPESLGFTLLRSHEREPEAPNETGVVKVWAITKEQWSVL